MRLLCISLHHELLISIFHLVQLTSTSLHYFFSKKQWNTIIEYTLQLFISKRLETPLKIINSFFTNQMSDAVSAETPAVDTIQEKPRKKEKTVIPQGIGPAGKVWRTNHAQRWKALFHHLIHRFSQFATNGALQVKTSWEAKMEKRRKLQRTKELEKNLTEARIEEKRVMLSIYSIRHRDVVRKLRTDEPEESRTS